MFKNNAQLCEPNPAKVARSDEDVRETPASAVAGQSHAGTSTSPRTHEVACQETATTSDAGTSTETREAQSFETAISGSSSTAAAGVSDTDDEAAVTAPTTASTSRQDQQQTSAILNICDTACSLSRSLAELFDSARLKKDSTEPAPEIGTRFKTFSRISF